MINKIIKWFQIKILKRQYIKGTNYKNGKDFGCKVYGYKDKNGVMKITNVKYF